MICGSVCASSCTGANFSPGGGTYTHSTTVSLNGSLVGSAVVPSVSRIENNIPSQSLILGGSSPTQLLSLRSTHTNGTHYTVASGFTVTVDYDEHTRTGCFTQAEVDAAATSGGPLMCTPSSVLVVPEQELELRLFPAEDEDLPQNADGAYVVAQGRQITLSAQIEAEGIENITQPVTIELTVPDGIAPRGMTIQGEDQSFLDALFTLLNAINPDLAGLANAILGIDVTDTQTTFTYTLENGVTVGQPFPITLDVVGDQVGEFIVTGEAVVLPQEIESSTASLFTIANEIVTSNAEAKFAIIENGLSCPAVINLRPDVPSISLREAPNRNSTAIDQLNDDDQVTLLGINLAGTWAYIQSNELLGWVSLNAVSFAGCTTYEILDDDAMPIAGAPYDFVIDVTNISSFRDSTCLRGVPDTASDEERNANFRGCARVVLYYFSTQFSSESPMRMSDVLSAVYSGELSVLLAAAGDVPLGLNSFSSTGVDGIGREALINNFWAVAYELRRECLESENCDFVLSPEEIADNYLYQVQSWYQNALPFRQAPDSGQLQNYYATSRAYRGLSYEALLSADRTIEGRPWQWGNYGFGNSSYADIQTNVATAYCYIYRAFRGNPEDGVQYVQNQESWDDYKFAIITTRSIGTTSTFDIQAGANRPGWLDATIPNPDDPNRPLSYVTVQFGSRGNQFLPCDISSSAAYLSGS